MKAMTVAVRAQRGIGWSSIPDLPGGVSPDPVEAAE